MKVKRDPTTKPYYMCFSCPDFRKECGGLPTRELPTPGWCEYIRDVMDFAHLTNAYVSQEADVSLKTVEWVSAGGKDRDITRSNARRIELVVLGPVGRHQCKMKNDFNTEQIKQLMEEVAYWKKENDRKAKIIDKYLDA